MAFHSGQSWARWRLILDSLGRDGVAFWAILGRDDVSFWAVLRAMASHSGQSWARWRLILGSLWRFILGSLGRGGVSFWTVFGAIAGTIARARVMPFLLAAIKLQFYLI